MLWPRSLARVFVAECPNVFTPAQWDAFLSASPTFISDSQQPHAYENMRQWFSPGVDDLVQCMSEQLTVTAAAGGFTADDDASSQRRAAKRKSDAPLGTGNKRQRICNGKTAQSLHRKYHDEAVEDSHKCTFALDNLERVLVELECIFSGDMRAGEKSMTALALFATHTIEMFGSMSVEHNKKFEPFRSECPLLGLGLLWLDMQVRWAPATCIVCVRSVWGLGG